MNNLEILGTKKERSKEKKTSWKEYSKHKLNTFQTRIYDLIVITINDIFLPGHPGDTRRSTVLFPITKLAILYERELYSNLWKINFYWKKSLNWTIFEFQYCTLVITRILFLENNETNRTSLFHVILTNCYIS